MNLHRSGEDYLEAILVLQRKNGYVRSLDIAEYMGVTKPSISNATKLLREGGFITMDKANSFTLPNPASRLPSAFMSGTVSSRNG